MSGKLSHGKAAAGAQPLLQVEATTEEQLPETKENRTVRLDMRLQGGYVLTAKALLKAIDAVHVLVRLETVGHRSKVVARASPCTRAHDCLPLQQVRRHQVAMPIARGSVHVPAGGAESNERHGGG